MKCPLSPLYSRLKRISRRLVTGSSWQRVASWRSSRERTNVESLIHRQTGRDAEFHDRHITRHLLWILTAIASDFPVPELPWASSVVILCLNWGILSTSGTDMFARNPGYSVLPFGFLWRSCFYYVCVRVRRRILFCGKSFGINLYLVERSIWKTSTISNS